MTPEPWTIQSLIDANMAVIARCACGHVKQLPLAEIKAQVGDIPAMPDDLRWKLRCDDCGEANPQLSYEVDKTKIAANAYAKARDGR